MLDNWTVVEELQKCDLMAMAYSESAVVLCRGALATKAHPESEISSLNVVVTPSTRQFNLIYMTAER